MSKATSATLAELAERLLQMIMVNNESLSESNDENQCESKPFVSRVKQGMLHV